MVQVEPPRREQNETTAMLRGRRRPTRSVGTAVIVARPSDGVPVRLEGTAAVIWRLLEDWTTPAAIDRRLAEEFPEVPPDERTATRAVILGILRDDGLIEPR